MARVRSPAYPALSLSDVIDMIRKVYSEQQTAPEPREVVLNHMGYSGKSGRSDKAFSALIKYGFLENVGAEGLRVSDRAVAILYPDPNDPTIKEKALIAAAYEPELFREMFERYPTRPSDASLEHFLINKGFNTSAIPQVARAFYDTFDLVSKFNDSYDSQNKDDPDKGEDKKMQNPDTTEREVPHADVVGIPETKGPLNSTNPVFDFETVRIHTAIDNQEDLSELISRLEKIKSMLPLKTQH